MRTMHRFAYGIADKFCTQLVDLPSIIFEKPSTISLYSYSVIVFAGE